MIATTRRIGTTVRDFLATQAGGGLLLILVAAAALAVANSPLGPLYERGLAAKAGGLSVLHWINDGLMAVFFLLVGLEIKREFVEGELATWRLRALPGLAALGGMAVPALVYVAVNVGPGGAPKGWAVPAATDIAFALGVISLLGSRVPPPLKVFLAALAIIDDLGAVIIIAAFYTSGLDLLALGGAVVVAAGLFGLNRVGVSRLLPYLVGGALLWFLVLRSGVHATVAGVVLALAIPLSPPDGEESSPLHRLEHALSGWVSLLIVPVFGFANAGVSLAGLSPRNFADPVPLGVMLGLFLGKQAGVFGAAWLAIRSGLAARPPGITGLQLYGVAILCGIGFTMSLFIGLLAFQDAPALLAETKLGVFSGSLLSGLVGALVLVVAGRRASEERASDHQDGVNAESRSAGSIAVKPECCPEERLRPPLNST